MNEPNAFYSELRSDCSNLVSLANVLFLSCQAHSSLAYTPVPLL